MDVAAAPLAAAGAVGATEKERSLWVAAGGAAGAEVPVAAAVHILHRSQSQRIDFTAMSMLTT